MAKVSDSAVIPTKNEEDAGYDLYSCFKEKELEILPSQIELIPSGISFAFNSNLVGIIKERGSTGSIGLSTRMGIIDSGYRGEVVIGINNTSSKKIIISKNHESKIIEKDVIYYPYSKAIAQILFISIPKNDVKLLSYEELSSMESERGKGLLGSTNK